MDPAELRQAARPEAILAALEAKAADLVDPLDHHGGGATSVREVDYQGHHIVIRTTYEIEVDGRPFEAHVGVANDGRVHYHGLPTRDFASMVDLVRKVIDQFPEDFPPGGSPEPEPDPGHGGHGGHGGGGPSQEPDPDQGGGGGHAHEHEGHGEHGGPGDDDPGSGPPRDDPGSGPPHDDPGSGPPHDDDGGQPHGHADGQPHGHAGGH